MTSERTSLAARRVADVLRVLVLASAVFVLLRGEIVATGGFLVVLFVLVLARVLKVPAPFDAAFCFALLAATWAAAEGWYTSIAWMDEVVHVVAPGATAAASYLMLAQLQMLPDSAEQLRAAHRVSVVLLVTTLGLGLAAIWEFLEWLGEQVSPADVHVGYTDTVGDLMLGGLGSLVAGVLLLLWERRRRVVGKVNDR